MSKTKDATNKTAAWYNVHQLVQKINNKLYRWHFLTHYGDTVSKYAIICCCNTANATAGHSVSAINSCTLLFGLSSMKINACWH